jgi:hypothetical protein
MSIVFARRAKTIDMKKKSTMLPQASIAFAQNYREEKK